MRVYSKIKPITILVIIAIVISLFPFSVTSVKADDEYNGLRSKWKNMLVGGTYDQTDPDISAQITSITTTANSYWSTLNKAADRTYLWSNLSNWSTKSADITSSFSRLKSMAIAYNTKGSSLYGNTSLAQDIVNALDWMYTNVYNEAIINEYDNWWDWEIGTPQALNDTAVLMYDQLTTTEITNYINAVDRFCSDPTIRTVNKVSETGANRADKAQVVIIRGILGKSGTKIAQGRDALSQIFLYVTSGDGFYTDGSLIQHSNVAYTLSYGAVLLSDMARLLYILKDSSWDVTDQNVQNVYNWVVDSYQPLIYKGAAMVMASGRKISRIGEQEHVTGQGIIASIARLSQLAPSAQASSFKSMVKAWVQQDTTFANYYSNLAIYDVVQIKSIMNDNTITPGPELIKNHVFADMDRVVHLRPGFGFGLSMFSNRISAFEYGNGENLKGWWTGLGMTYLYNNDLTQYDNNYWPTVNSYRLPGTTTDGTGSGTPTAWKFYSNPYNWVGGSSVDDLYGSAGMNFSLSQDTGSPLQGKKSWFMFGDKMVALGAGITDTNNANVETIVENRKLNSNGDNALTVNGTAKPNNLGWSDTMSGVQWAHLAGNAAGSDVGYYFPGGTTLYGLRESRTGAWSDLNTGQSTTPYTNNFLSLAFEHGANPTNASYAYAVLPNKSAADMAAYASNPDISILENDEDVQAVKDTTLNTVGANFWNDLSKTVSINGTSFITSNKKASVTTLESNGQIDIGVSDPTQANSGTINIEINRKASGVISLDPGITVTQLSPTIKMSINVKGAQGKNFNAKFNLGSAVTPAAPVLDTPTTGISSQVTLNWASVGGETGYNLKYGTAPGSYTNTIKITDVSGLNSYTVTGLTNSTPYYFAVSATSSAGESTNSNEQIAIPNIAANAQVTLGDAADSYVNDGTLNANTNYGTNSGLLVKNDAVGFYRSSFLKFDLSTITGTVWNAQIKLVPITEGMSGIINQATLVNDNTWNENTITWNNQPSIGTNKPLAQWTVPAVGTPVSFDVTDQVKASLTGDKLLSIVVTSPSKQSSNASVTYASKENSNKSYRPVIVINSSSMDSKAPSTTAAITPGQPDGQNGWYVHPVTMSLAANDNLSGVAKTEYSLDGGEKWQSYYTPVKLAQDGKYSIGYRSTDYAGNQETMKTVNLNLDMTPPETTATATPAQPDSSNSWYINPVTVTLNASDNTSGVEKTEYSLDGGTTWQAYTGSVTISQEDKNTLSYRSTDNAGNVGALKTVSFKLDTTAPEITVSDLVQGTLSDSGDITPIIKLSDNLSGVDSSKTTITLDTNGVQQGTTIPLYTLPLGSHRYTVTASDIAGNVSSQTITFQTTTSTSILQELVNRFTKSKWIDNDGIVSSLQEKLSDNDLDSFVAEVKAQREKQISSEAAKYLLRDAQYLLSIK
ncbi:DNRLRE domain-containing protein [Priestia megaterium]|uniref:DNRLRE domain-containing protein n=1 Tax=Priestia megaterium TaxID=1404 RepID=A0A6H1P1A5_PRIMG|nr:polysaccharide lyase family 8 super-sandwich domain-containing protein [Priestia megaterium]QIZ07197.1 DNRLRE domain-containing protein [Priestia megaterium]